MPKVINLMAERFGLPPEFASMIIRSAPHRYKVYQIAKRSGTGTRTIAQPAKAIKELQRWLVKEVLNDLPVHDCATAYRKNSSIKRNAELHAPQNFLLKMDFSNFFPSISGQDISKHLRKYVPGQFDAEDLNLINSALLWRPRGGEGLVLSIGAPSSPYISNSIVFDFDNLIADHCAGLGVVYSRYADDMAFSTSEPGVLREIEKFVGVTCAALDYPTLQINANKTVHTSKKHRRFVTGLTLSSEGNISLGRDRKRLIRSMIYRASQAKLTTLEMKTLGGWLAFAIDVEPQFVAGLQKKFGSRLLDQLLQMTQSRPNP